MSKPTDVLLPHVSDGIQEFDNPLPAWWLGIFYFTIVFSIFFVPYLAITGWSQEKQYDSEIAAAEALYGGAEAEEAASGTDTPVAAFEPTAADIEAGKAVFAANCVACHAADGTGGIGPDLTDAEWIHGGDLAAITATVANGVVEKGMLAWGPVLGQEKVRQVSAYVETFTAK